MIVISKDIPISPKPSLAAARRVRVDAQMNRCGVTDNNASPPFSPKAINPPQNVSQCVPRMSSLRHTPSPPSELEELVGDFPARRARSSAGRCRRVGPGPSTHPVVAAGREPGPAAPKCFLLSCSWLRSPAAIFQSSVRLLSTVRAPGAPQHGSHPLTQVSGMKDWRVRVLIIVGVNAAGPRQHRGPGLAPDTAACYLPLSTLPEPAGPSVPTYRWGGPAPAGRGWHGPRVTPPSRLACIPHMPWAPRHVFWLISHENDP